MPERLKKHSFLFKMLVKRDFTRKYKRTVLGMAWSVLSPLMNLLIMWLVFSHFFGSNVDHYVIYLFTGQMIFSYFSDATGMGMSALLNNAAIFTRVNVPKYLFLFSQNVSSLINFGLTLLIYFAFVAVEGIAFTWRFLLLLYPLGCLVLFNTGLGLVLSALQVFFRDMQYLWSIATQLLMWLSAIFYSIDSYPPAVRTLFLFNPVYLYIRYFRKIVLETAIPSAAFHAAAGAYALLFFALGCHIYRKYNQEFLYYV